METIGQQLKQARETKKLTLSEAAARTQIKTQQLEALEQDDFSAMPAPIYTKGFIKLYAKTLGLDGAALVEQFNASQAEASQPDVEVGAEVLDKKPVIEQDEDDKEATITHAKPSPLSGAVPKKPLNAPDWMMRVGKYLPLVAALVVVMLMWLGLKSCIGPSQAEGGVDLGVFDRVSPLIAEPPEPYLKLE